MSEQHNPRLRNPEDKCPICGHRWMPEHRSRDEGCKADVSPDYEECGCEGPDEWRG